MSRILIFILFFLSFSFAAFCQDADFRITRDYEGKPFTDFIRETEQKFSIRIYYPDSVINEIYINENFQNTPLISVLGKILRNTDYSAILYSPQQIVIVKDLNKSPLQEDEVPASQADQQSILLNGYVRDANTGERILGATVFITELSKGTSTNQSGFFTLNAPQGHYTIEVNSIGYLPERKSINLTKKQTLTFELYEKSIQLQEVTITEFKPDQNVTGTQMGRNSMNLKTLKSIPPFLGEVDVFRSIILLPGVSTVGERAAGFNVRGGSVDQNLILLEDAPIFNPSHLFGFFSAFNSDIIHETTLYRGGIPTRFGGRISSILNVRLKEGNKNKISGQGGIGIVSNRLSVDGPIFNDKTTFVLAGRASYSDWLIGTLKNKDLNKSSAQFYDLNAKITHRLNEKNSISLSGYLSNDSFSFASDTLYSWGNKSASLQ